VGVPDGTRLAPDLPMSKENLELVRRLYEAFNRGESAREFIAEDAEYVNPPYAVEPGIRRGREAFMSVRDTYADFRVDIAELIDAGDDVVVLARFSASGPRSGVRLEGEHGSVWTVRDGQGVRFQWFRSHREALEAAGVDRP
jgi:ketosteroid isomerase-like protein